MPITSQSFGDYDIRNSHHRLLRISILIFVNTKVKIKIKNYLHLMIPNPDTTGINHTRYI